MTCSHCNDTGSLSKDLEGYLDCVHCGTAEERMRVEAWAKGQGLDTYDTAGIWTIYQRGKAAAATPP